VSVAARTADRAQASRAALVGTRLGAVPLLAALVAGSFAVRTALAWLRSTPTFFPDEYIYAELARSLADTGRPLIRGASAGFPALLQPILTAPAWLVDDVGASFRIVQTFGSLVMSLAAVPVFVLARRLRLGDGIALGLAALAVAVPDLLYSSFVVSEPLAYPLVLAAVVAGAAGLARPSRRAQLVFLLLAGLAALARVQFVVLPLCFLAAAVAVGLRERRLRTVLREQALVGVLLALPLVAVAAAGPGRLLGFYGGVLDLDLLQPDLAKWFGVDALVLGYAAGIVLAPGAVLGLWLSIRSPRSREELAFGALAASFLVALLLEAAAYGIDGSRVQERYFFYAVPLVGIAFALYASRGWPHRLGHAVVAAALVAAAARVPLSGFIAADGKTNAPLLYAAARLEQLLGDVGLASLVISVGVTFLLAVLVIATWRGRRAASLVLAIALAVSGTASAAAVSFTLANASRTKNRALGPEPSFADHAGLEGSAMLASRTTERALASAYLFWNRTVDDVYLLPDATPPDAFAVTRLAVAPDGTLLADGDPVTRPLLVDSFSDTVVLRDSTPAAAALAFRLVRSTGPQRLELYAPGRFADGWLGLRGSIRLWPEDTATRLAGRLAFTLTAPAGAGPVAVRFEEPGRSREVVVSPGVPSAVSFDVCGGAPWHVDFTAPSTGTVGSRFVSVRATRPAYRADPSACPQEPSS
jgi:hypothetical protein